MYQHYRRIVERIAERVHADLDVLALVIIGSVARGDARADSDIDGYLFVSDESYQARGARGALTWNADDL